MPGPHPLDANPLDAPANKPATARAGPSTDAPANPPSDMRSGTTGGPPSHAPSGTSPSTLPPAPLATPPIPEPLNKADMTALGLAIVGALNWGLVGLFNRNLVSGLFGKNTLLSRTVYATVGAAGAYAIFSAAKARRVAQAA